MPRTSHVRLARPRALPVYLSVEAAVDTGDVGVIQDDPAAHSDGRIPACQCGRRNIRIRLDELEAAFRRLPSARL